MADLYSDIPELSAEQAGILRRKKIAELIQARSMQPIEESQPVGRFRVPVSPLQGIGKVLEAYLGKKAGEEADTAQTDLGKKYSGMEDTAVADYIRSRQPQPAIPMPETGGPGRPEMIPTAQDIDQADLQAQTSDFPKLRVAGALQARLTEQEQARKENIAARAEAAKISADARLESDRQRRDMMMLLAGNKTDAAQEKAQAKIDAKEEAKTGFESSLSMLESKYKDLDKLGGIVNPDKSGISNVGSRLASSALGQTMGGIIGSDEQSIRNEIIGTIPLLVLDIKNMTGASAQQMNSNIELQNFLKAASDPKTDIRSALSLLGNLRKKYLGENKLPASPNEPAVPTAPNEENWVRDANGKLVKQ